MELQLNFPQRRGALNIRRTSIITDPQEMHAVLGRITVTVLPKMCQQILESIISANNLYCSFQNRSDLKIVLVEAEQATITTMASNGYKHFTVQLCYKILRKEQWVGAPRQNWGNVPLHTDKHISDDIERIRLARNKIVSMETRSLDSATFLTLIDEFKEIAKRVDFYLKKDAMFLLQMQSTESMTKAEIESTVDEIRRLSVIEDDPFPVHTINQGRTNYARLGLVVVDMFPNILREIMRNNIAPEVLYRHIGKQRQNNPSVFNKMTHEEQVNLNTLTNKTYEDIDFTTMYKLMRSFSLLDDPTKGWGKQPTNADLTISDDVERLRFARNKIVHRIKTDINLTEMNDSFSNIVDITERIDTYLGKLPGQKFAREVLNFQTHCMDSAMEQKYYQALKEIEDIQEKFSVESVHFYYGKTFTNFIRDVQNKAKRTVRKTISLVLEDINEDEKRMILNELKTEINSGLVNIEFKRAVSGSLIIYIDILDSNLLSTEHELGHQIYMFLCKALQLAGFNLKTENEITVVLIKEEDDIEVEFPIESDNWEIYGDEISLRSNSLYLEFDVNTEIFNTEHRMQSEMGLFVRSVLGSNGKSNIGSVSARLEPGIVDIATPDRELRRKFKRNMEKKKQKSKPIIEFTTDQPQERNNRNEETPELFNLQSDEECSSDCISIVSIDELGDRSQSSKNERVNRTNDAGNGIEIILPQYLLLEDSHLESVVWNPDEHRHFFEENNFTNQQRFMTSIYHIYKKDPSEPQKSNGSYISMSYPEIAPHNITVNVHIPELSQVNGLCLVFHAHVRFGTQWTIIDAFYKHKEGFVVAFNCNQIESFFIVSTPQQEKHIVSPDGCEFVSKADIRIKIYFPVGSVSQDENVEIKVIPVNRELMATKILSNPNNSFVLAISECLSVQHSRSSFDPPVNIQLPVDDLPGIDTTNIECKYGVFKRKHSGSFTLTNLEVEERYGVPTVTVNSFIDYVIVKVSISAMYGQIISLVPEEIEVGIGEKTCCKILFFLGNHNPNSLSVMLECVAKNSMEDVTQRRSLEGYKLVRQCPSPDFFFRAKQRIRVYVAGRFALDKHIGKNYYVFTFLPFAADNFINFPVHRYSGMESAAFGIMSFREDNAANKDLYVIHYDPWSSRGKPQGNLKMQYAQSTQAMKQKAEATDHLRDSFHTNFDESFFSDKGLLAVAHLLSSDAMFKVVINLDMTKAHYHRIMTDNPALTTASRHLQLLRAALEIKSSEYKCQRLLSALRESDENTIAEKIYRLYFQKEDLSISNLER